MGGRHRVFHDAGQSGVCHDETSFATALKAMGQQAEGIGVSFEVGNVVPEFLRYMFFQVGSLAFGEIGLNGFLARMSKRRIAHVVSQAGCADDSAYLWKQRVNEFRTVL